MTVWQTQDGRIISIKEMDDYHLLNTIAFLDRHKEDLLSGALFATESFSSAMTGEMAIDSINDELMNLHMMDADEFLEERTAYSDLIKEAQKRGLPT